MSKKIKKTVHRLKRFVFKCNQYRINHMLKNESLSDTDFFFVQIGSSDGISGDPIYAFVKQYQWRGILVEPVKYLYDKLLANYNNQPGLIFENIAIHAQPGKRILYRMKKREKPDGGIPSSGRMGSFNKDLTLKNASAKIHHLAEEHLVEETVMCHRLDDLLKKHNVSKINLLAIDTEGYDYEIIKMVPFDTVKPRMIFYENAYLSPADKRACVEMLKSYGYKIIKSKDTFAYLPKKALIATSFQ